MAIDNILSASVSVATRLGVSAWTIDAVARQAGCAKGLVLYHYRSKANLLGATAAALEQTRWHRRFEAIAGRDGLEAIDRLWEAMVLDVDSGAFGGWLSLTAAGHRESGPGRAEEFRATVSRVLGLPSDGLADAASIMAMLEGIELGLLRTQARAALRTSYDRLWASLVVP